MSMFSYKKNVFGAKKYEIKNNRWKSTRIENEFDTNNNEKINEW